MVTPYSQTLNEPSSPRCWQRLPALCTPETTKPCDSCAVLTRSLGAAARRGASSAAGPASQPRPVHAVYHWIRVAVQHDPVSRAKYQAPRARGHTHGRTLRSVADRLLAVAWAMLRAGRLFDSRHAAVVHQAPATVAAGRGRGSGPWRRATRPGIPGRELIDR